MTSAARRAAALILASSLLAACSGGGGERVRGDQPVNGGGPSAPAAPAPSSSGETAAEPATSAPATPEATAPAGPTSSTELTTALYGLTNVTDADLSGDATHIWLDAVNMDTVRAAIQIVLDNEAELADDAPSVVIWGPPQEDESPEFMIQYWSFDPAPADATLDALAVLVDITSAASITSDPDGWGLSATVSAAEGEDWHTRFQQAYEIARMAADAGGVNEATTTVGVEYFDGVVGPVVPISLGDVLMDPVWATIIDQVHAADVALLTGETSGGYSRCEVHAGPSVQCFVGDPSLGTTDGTSLAALQALQATVEGAGYTFSIEDAAGG